MATLFCNKEQIYIGKVRPYFCTKCQWKWSQPTIQNNPVFCPNCGVKFDSYHGCGCIGNYCPTACEWKDACDD